MTTGYVALLDVLGFSDLISGRPGDQNFSSYLECIKESLDDESVGAIVPYIVFSDSIVLTSDDSSVESLHSVVLRCSRLFGRMLAKGIAIRGAVSYGDYSRATTGGGIFVAGRAIIEAYRFEQTQDWVGIMLTPSILRQIPDKFTQFVITADDRVDTLEGLDAIRLRARWSGFVQEIYNIPFHNDNPFNESFFHGFAIVPTDGVANEQSIMTSLGNSLKSLKNLKMYSPNPATQRKYSHAESWLSTIHAKWADLVWRRARLDTVT